jgi:hypothetical protein
VEVKRLSGSTSDEGLSLINLKNLGILNADVLVIKVSLSLPLSLSLSLSLSLARRGCGRGRVPSLCLCLSLSPSFSLPPGSREFVSGRVRECTEIPGGGWQGVRRHGCKSRYRMQDDRPPPQTGLFCLYSRSLSHSFVALSVESASVLVPAPKS